MPTYFSDQFEIRRTALKKYGAFDISLVTDLPLFIDPFLLFNSKKRRYRELHREVIRYLTFLRDRAADQSLDQGLLKAWFHFPEVKQTWLGFAKTGNRGSGLGNEFAKALHDNLHRVFSSFGKEEITRGSHLEKLCLIKGGVGRDNISDFTTNLIKAFLCEYSQEFARKHLRPQHRQRMVVPRVRFNYESETWAAERFELPWANGDYILLTPKDILTRDDTWINKTDLVEDFERLPEAISDDALRAQVNNYFHKVLRGRRRREPTREERDQAVRATLLEWPQLIDVYIRDKEDRGDQANSLSSAKVEYSQKLYVEQFKGFQEYLARQTDFYRFAGRTYEEAHKRVAFLKDVIENKGGHRFFYVDGRPMEREEDVHIMYRLTWFGTPSDVSREVNDGRGPADFKVSRGAKDKTIVEFKLAKNTHLRSNLAKQAEIYKKASDAQRAIKVIVYFAHHELRRVEKILKELGLLGHQDVVLIDAGKDNKPSGSKA